MELKEKVALVTGGGVRVGRAIVLALAQAGCDVFIHYGNSARSAEQVKAEAESLGVRAFTYSANLADPKATATAIPKAIAALGRVDILINSASIFPENDRFSEVDLALWDEMFAINLRAPFQLSQQFAEQLPSERMGKIVNINDSRISHPNTDRFSYRLTKSALSEMTKMLALELAPRITANSLELGAILVPPNTPDPERFKEDYASRYIPLKKFGDPKVVTDSILFLLDCDWITGATIRIDGGKYI